MSLCSKPPPRAHIFYQMGVGGDGEHPTINKIALSSLSAASAESTTFPIDTIKTRLQLQVRHGNIDSPRRPSVRSVASDIWARGGALGFYSGLSPAVVRHLFYTPIRIVGYEHLRHAGGDSVLGKALSGGVSGVLAQIVASPADLIKVRMQADSSLLGQGLQPRYSSIFDALRKIIRTEGILGFWRGVLPNVQRAFLVNMGELTCYDQAKHFIIDHNICGDNIFSHTLASVASGLCATALSCPADVIKTRMMNQSAGKEESSRAMYKGTYDCLVKTVKFEGTMSLWKGFFPTWARLGPWQFVFWVTYEKLRHVSGLSSF